MRGWIRLGWVAYALLVSGSAMAQDTRAVTEPKIPPICTKLEAKLLGSTDGRILDGAGKKCRGRA